MQRAIIGDITEMGITPAELIACQTCLNQGGYCTSNYTLVQTYPYLYCATN